MAEDLKKLKREEEESKNWERENDEKNKKKYMEQEKIWKKREKEIKEAEDKTIRDKIALKELKKAAEEEMKKEEKRLDQIRNKEREKKNLEAEESDTIKEADKAPDTKLEETTITKSKGVDSKSEDDEEENKGRAKVKVRKSAKQRSNSVTSVPCSEEAFKKEFKLMTKRLSRNLKGLEDLKDRINENPVNMANGSEDLKLLRTNELTQKKMGHMKPPDNLLTSARPPPAFVPYSQPPPPVRSDPGASLQESPDYLGDDDIPDSYDDEQSPRMERNHSQVIIPDLPPDYEYDHAGEGSARKRGNKRGAREEEVTKKARLNVPGDESDRSVFFSANNTLNTSTEEIEILDETPGKTLEERTKGLMQLKRKAQSFIRASRVSANTPQSKLDDWVVRSPKKVVTMDISDDPEIIFDGDQSQESSVKRRPGGSSQNDIIEPEESSLDTNAGPDQPSRRQRKGSPGKITKSKSLSNHFLAKTRSGSTRSSSVRSLKSSDSSFPLFSMPSLMSQNSTASQDSFCSEAGSDICSTFEFQENILHFRILVTQWPSSSDFAEKIFGQT